MIQRIQSLYLFIAGLLTFGMFALPMLQFASSGQVHLIYTCHIRPAISNSLAHAMVPTAVVFTLSGLLSIYAIFLFKNRRKQILVIRVNMLTMFAAFATLVITGFRIAQGSNTAVKPAFALIIPLLVILFLYLALKGVKKDEELIKSADRLR